jgi:simple sugar transport system substrate-binding protein
MGKTAQIFSQILLISGIMLTLAACDSTRESSKQTPIPVPEKKYKIATLVKVDGIPWFARMRVGVTRFADTSGQDAFMVGPARADGALQAQMIDELVNRGVNAICIVPFSVSAVEPALKIARGKGIVIVAHEASNIENADIIIEPFDNKAWGRHLMDELASCMQRKGPYAIILGSYGSQSHMEWYRAAVAHQLEKYPNMKLETEAIEDHDNPARSYARAKELLSRFSDLRGILGFTMVSCPSAALAVETAGLKNKVGVVGVSLVSACKSYLADGSLKKISFWDPADAGYVMNKIALKLLQGGEVKAGDDMGVKGYHDLRRDMAKPNLFFGKGWIDVTKENMANYPY